MKTYVYYLRVNKGEAYKIGITCKETVIDRFISEDRKKIVVLYVWSFEDRTRAFKKEQEILKKFSQHRFMGQLLDSGNTELFDRDVLNLEVFDEDYSESLFVQNKKLQQEIVDLRVIMTHSNLDENDCLSKRLLKQENLIHKLVRTVQENGYVIKENSFDLIFDSLAELADYSLYEIGNEHSRDMFIDIIKKAAYQGFYKTF